MLGIDRARHSETDLTSEKNTKLKVIMNNMNIKKRKKRKCCTLQNPMQINRIRINTNYQKKNKKNTKITITKKEIKKKQKHV